MELRTDEDEDEDDGDGDSGYNDHWDDHEGDDGTGRQSSRNWFLAMVNSKASF